MSGLSVQEQILSTASELFYRNGIHAVGVDSIIAQAGVAKSSLYRHYRTKDELIAAYLQSEDDAFWKRWDAIALDGDSDPRRVLFALLTWIGTKIATPGYRGCPQLNVAAEFPDMAHPARIVASRHKAELRHRLAELATKLRAPVPVTTADQLWLLIDGAFSNYALLADHDPVRLLTNAATALLPPTRKTKPSLRGANSSSTKRRSS